MTAGADGVATNPRPVLCSQSHLSREPITEERIDGLFVALTEILRLYRAFIAHGQDL